MTSQVHDVIQDEDLVEGKTTRLISATNKNDNFEHSFVIIKPDCVERGKSHMIIKMIEDKNLKLEYMKVVTPTEGIIKMHYKEHKGKDFFKKLVRYMISGQCIIMLVSGYKAIEAMKNISERVRRDIKIDNTRNSIHTSDDMKSALREFNLWENEKILCAKCGEKTQNYIDFGNDIE